MWFDPDLIWNTKVVYFARRFWIIYFLVVGVIVLREENSGEGEWKDWGFFSYLLYISKRIQKINKKIFFK